MKKAVIGGILVPLGIFILIFGDINDYRTWLGIIPLVIGIFLYGKVTVDDYKRRNITDR